MNGGEVNTKKETQVSRTANPDNVSTRNQKAGLKWDTVDWYKVEAFVNKAQTRIAKAAAKGKWKLVRELQRMLTHSYYAKLWAIRKVTGTSGKRTAGIDKEKWNTSAQKYNALEKMNQKGYRAKALKRVYIPKSNGKMRPLSIPTMTDRAMQALEALALDPIIESMSDKHSFGFRKGRSCQDAREQLFIVLSKKHSAEWIVEGDIKSCFDEIAHEWLLEHTPMDKRILRQFLKAGYVYEKELYATDKGTPQGGVISPILANHTLNGIDKLLAENFVKKRWTENGVRITQMPKINLTRYADDFVVTARTKETAEKAKELIKEHIAERGLQLSEEKTMITHITEGFDLLGWNFRKYKGVLLIKPSKKSQERILQKIREVIHKNIGATQDNLIARLNPIIDGWSNYHQGAVSRKVFERIDHMTYLALWAWARKRHPNKGKRWIKNRYWKTVGNRHWVFMDKLELRKMSDKKIVRHIPLKLDMNPYIDRDYFYRRSLKLLINRKFGNKQKPAANPQAATGKNPEGSCLHEA